MDGSFTLDDSNSFLSLYEILPTAQENKTKKKFKKNGILREIFLFYHENVCCVYSLELPHCSNSNEYTQHTIILLEDGKDIPRLFSFAFYLAQ